MMTDIVAGTNHAIRREAAQLAGLRNKAELAREVAADDEVRRALADLVGLAQRLGHSLDMADIRGELGRLARDRRLQEQIGALLRASARVLDASVDVGRRKARRRLGRFVLAGSAVAVLAFVAASQARNINRPVMPGVMAEGRPGAGA